jgi:hypothetical protein
MIALERQQRLSGVTLSPACRNGRFEVVSHAESAWAPLPGDV